MAPLARLPVFFDLNGRRALVACGPDETGAGALWKAELLSAAGAEVDVLAPAPSADLLNLAAAPPQGAIRIISRRYQPTDFAGAILAIGDFTDAADAAAFADAARAAGVVANVIDTPGVGDFTFGSVVNRSPLVVAISTDGAAPVFAQAIRARIEAMLPQGFGRWVAAAKTWRSAVGALHLPAAARRLFWERFSTRAFAAPDHAPDTTERDMLLAGVSVGAQAQRLGSVALVGAGPGDPELLTLKAVRTLQSADVVLFDDLVAPAVLDFARRESKKMLVGKTGHGPSCSQDDINALMVKLALEGRRVVRLKGGDPMVFGRAGEEIAACRAAGIAVEVVPGISAAQGAAAALGVSLTHRDHARRLQFVTAHGRDGRLPADLDWRSLADPAATTVVYMGRRTLPALVERLAAAGIDPATPAIAVFCATRPQERRLAAPLAGLPAAIDAAVGDGAEGPCLVLYGAALGAAGWMAQPGSLRASA